MSRQDFNFKEFYRLELANFFDPRLAPQDKVHNSKRLFIEAE